MSKPTNDYVKYTGIAFQMIAIIGVLSFVGYEIDKRSAHQTPWVTAMLSLAGVFIALYLVIKSVKE
ncbi:AtpZ/AtpI family protein [Mucilaginibacter galii]|uniref:AtpZ/AtpI family protein n=1 Tax=Mucilaginibacter galii TaxID=2005073 RepID=A0A917N071_9SPHI|nr:AtpZ/AtpI family protein [Mucilaginibacter galii]GGI49520.1 hypothetical protein GCM10011425_07320 [Mucilaginibacter galii]